MKYVALILTLLISISSCMRTNWSVELWEQKIENSNYSVYKYDAWGGRDTHLAGYKVLDSVDGFKQRDVLESHGFSYLKSIPNRDTITIVSLSRKTGENTIPVLLKSTEYRDFISLIMKTNTYEYNGESTKKSFLKSYRFKSFQETRDSLIFFSNRSQFVDGIDYERISIPKGNILLMTSKDNRKVVRIIYEDIVIPYNEEGNDLVEGEAANKKLYRPTIYFDPIEDIDLSEFSDYGIFKPVK